jgi:hypothetical protein
VLPGVRAACSSRWPPRLLPACAAAARGQARHLRPCRVHRLQPEATRLFAQWRSASTPLLLKGFGQGGHPKALIETIAEDLLATFKTAPLLDAYDVYQHLMDYWAETMQDDCYLIAADGWVQGAQPREVVRSKTRTTNSSGPRSTTTSKASAASSPT